MEATQAALEGACRALQVRHSYPFLLCLAEWLGGRRCLPMPDPLRRGLCTVCIASCLSATGWCCAESSDSPRSRASGPRVQAVLQALASVHARGAAFSRLGSSVPCCSDDSGGHTQRVGAHLWPGEVRSQAVAAPSCPAAGSTRPNTRGNQGPHSCVCFPGQAWLA